ncbi:BTAD domain-containing putative transcriptional regulator [Lentzea sp. BCCO 10_0856]|uniref:BTAD domain-containing putative transcriptional regulator n=1 Tax=Lentzea miocenica TaxID=3095431 RepID=A0ABU4TH79_9PSEU|nr:BTAD domain-containing putative transcriptional regulator [Lentzea sp. BCCO 10_0856]MDX8037547.1 BTAD domain-containing putative transcriptional regulator [Lentzea sp. BCCO 10_0856]
MIVEYRVLGPLEVLADSEPVAVPAGRGRVLLATLLLRANEFVPVDELVDQVWDGEPPAPDRAHKTLQMVVARLRQSLGAANCVRTSSRGYSAEVAPDQLDLARFRRLTAKGEHRAALELWRGKALANVQSESLHREDVPRLMEEQAVALERRIDQDLARVTDVLVPELRALVRQHPLREVFWAQLMLALHRAGQQAEALAVFQEIRKRLDDELGAAPGQRLREAHEQVLRDEVPATAVVPRQLPPAHPHFVGREHELARLTETLGTRPGEPVLISAINGIGGVGKTALALQWANRVADRFPDGQLYADLRGFDTRADPLDPLAVARDFLTALGVEQIPKSDDRLITAYRSALAQRRVLVVLDNARDVEQVRPLLPGGTANLVLITSRNRLQGLVASEGAHPVALDVLDEREAVGLLTERAGADRIAAEPEAVSRLVARCAGLPLALGIVAARAAYGDSLTALADELEKERLEALDVDDPATDVRAVFSWSLRSVSEAAARLFVLLGLHPGPDFTVAAAASLARLPAAAARRALTELVTVSLVATTRTGRFVLHDLLRDYAAERAAELPDQHEAVRVMLDHYLHTSRHAWARLQGNPAWPGFPEPAEHALVEPAADHGTANDWFIAEHEVLLRLATQALDTGQDDLAWRFVLSMHTALLRRGHVAVAESLELRGLDAARRAGDDWGLARLHRGLGGVYIATRALPAAEFHLRAALQLDTRFGDVLAESNLSRGLAQVFMFQQRHQEAVDLLLGVQPRIDDLPDFEQAHHLAALGTAYHAMGQEEPALRFCERARDRYRAMTGLAPSVLASANLEALAEIYLKLGRTGEAVSRYEESIALLRVMRATYDLAHTLGLLAKVLADHGERDRARASVLEAEAILGDSDSVQARLVREVLGTVVT